MKQPLIWGLSVALSSVYLAAMPVTASAYEAGDWLVRGRIINVNPQDDSSVISVGTPAAGVAGSGVSVNDDTVPELDITYMVHPNWGVELILGTSQHDVRAEGTLAGLGTVIDAWVLPPTLTLQYHFLPNGKFRPYAGLGVNYSHFYSEDVTGGLDAPGADVELESSWGVAAQIGADIAINEDWFVNLDAKYIKIDTSADFDNTTVGNAEVDVDIDPWVIGIGIGRRF